MALGATLVRKRRNVIMIENRKRLLQQMDFYGIELRKKTGEWKDGFK